MAKVIFWLQQKIEYTNSNYMQENVFDIQNKKIYNEINIHNN